MIILALLIAQAVPAQSTDKNILDAITVQSFELPKIVETAINPYFHCMMTGSDGVMITSLAQAQAIAAKNNERCASTRADSRKAATQILKKKARLLEIDAALFVEAVLFTVDDFADVTKAWCGQ